MRTHSGANPVSRRMTVVGLGGAALSLAQNASARADATPAPVPTPIPPRVEADDGVVYGEAGGEPLLLDVYRPVGWEAPRPAVVLFHGGGLIELSRDWVSVPATELALLGYVTFGVGYRLFDPETGANPWPAQLDDAQRAVRWVRAHAETYNVDPERIGSYGHSSGGTLAAAVGVRETRDDSDPDLAGISSRVTCVVDLSGDADLTIPYPDPFWNEINEKMLGGTPDEQPAAYRDASPLYQVDADSAPFLVIHGGEGIDEVPVEHARRLVTALHEAGVEVTYGEYPHASHHTTESWHFSGAWAVTFLGLHLRPNPASRGAGGCPP